VHFKPISLIFVAALFAGIVFFVLHRAGFTAIWLPALKGACVALLAVWAALQARTLDGWLITVALALGAVGDVLLETHGMIAGGAAFFGGHLTASWFYWRNREGRLWIVPAFMLATASCAYWVVATAGSALGIAVYAAGLGLMAGTALASRFAKAGAGLGASLFVASDLLIFAEQGPLSGSALPGILIWPLYVVAQATIAWGAVRTLRKQAT
jgi:uncharacterized membrane protein YhhN